MGPDEQTESDVRAFPTVEAYRRGLPEGWTSYPACRARAALLGSLAVKGALDGLEILPRPLSDHLAGVTGDWIPEVIHVAVLLAVRDKRFPGASGEDAFVAWLHRLNAELLPDRSSVGPERAVHELPAIWSSLHDGTQLVIVDAAPRRAVLASKHPAPLFPPLTQRWRFDAITAFLVKAGAVQPRVTELGHTDEELKIEVRWS